MQYKRLTWENEGPGLFDIWLVCVKTQTNGSFARQLVSLPVDKEHCAALGGELLFVGVGHVRGDVGAVGVARVGGVVPHALGHRRPLVGEGAALAAQMLGAFLFLRVSAVRAGATLSSMSMMVVTLCSGSSSR